MRIIEVVIILLMVQFSACENELTIRSVYFADDLVKSVVHLETATLLLLGSKKLKRTNDDGRTWKDTSMVMNSVDTLITSPVDRNVAIALEQNHVCSTRDSGETWKMIDIDSSIDFAIINAFQPDYVMFSAKVDDKTCVGGSCFRKMYLSRDFGYTIEDTHFVATEFCWGFDRAFAAIASSKFPQKLSILSSFDLFRSSNVILDNVDRFVCKRVQNSETVKEMLFAYRSSDIFISTDAGKSFNKARCTGPNQDMSTIKVLDASEGQALVSVEHGMLLKSDSLGTNFSISLPFIQSDLYQIVGIDGVYLVNALESDKKEMIVKKLGTNGRQVQSVTTTMITHNKGLSWSKIFPATILPSLSSSSTLCVNKASCTLYLNDLSTSNILSHPQAPGLVIANGKIISTGTDSSQVGTFLSRDGGISWNQIKNDGPKLFAFGDSGGIIVLADKSEPGSEIEYSYDEGLTWTSYNVSQEKINFQSISTNTDIKSTSFVIIGSRANLDQSTTDGIVISVTLGLGLRYCNPSIDYEIWFPNEGRYSNPDYCFLGRVMAISRRKQTAHCLNGKYYQLKKSTGICQCTEQDFECDFGYMKMNNNDDNSAAAATCVRDETVNLIDSILKEPDNCRRFYSVSAGYRKVIGDVCQNGVTHPLKRIPCVMHHGLTNKGFFLLCVIGTLCFGIMKGGKRASNILNLGSNILREANFFERFRDWFETRIWHHRHDFKYSLLSENQNDPVLFDVEEDEEEQLEEYDEDEDDDGLELVQTSSLSTPSTTGTFSSFSSSHFTIQLPFHNNQNMMTRRPPVESDLGDV